MKRRPIATRYAALVVALLSVALIASGTVEAWVSHRERQAALEALQREKVQAAATEVSRFVDDVLRSLDWVTLSAAPAGGELERRRLDFLKLLRLEPAITTATLVDAGGRERLRVSRIKPDRLDSGDRPVRRTRIPRRSRWTRAFRRRVLRRRDRALHDDRRAKCRTRRLGGARRRQSEVRLERRVGNPDRVDRLRVRRRCAGAVWFRIRTSAGYCR